MLGFKDKRPKYVAKEFIISLDFDGVLALGVEVKLKYAKIWYGVKPSLAQTKSSGFNALMKSIGKPEIDYIRDFRNHLVNAHQMEFKVPPHSQQVLVELHRQGFRFVVITSRLDYEYVPALHFLKRNFGGIVKKVVNVKPGGDKRTFHGRIIETLFHTRDEPKDKYVKRVGARIHVDDDLFKLKALLNTPAEAVYFRQPENQGKNVPITLRRVYEFRQWKEFYTYAKLIRDFHEAICWKNNLENNQKNLPKIADTYRSMDAGEIQQVLLDYRKQK